MSKGIYCYIDLQNKNSIVYIGKDAHINRNKRNKDHFKPSNYDVQQINRVVQNNPKRYKYEVLCEANHYSDVYLNCLEKGLIKVYDPKFNFTKGGDGVLGYKPSEETKKRISESHKLRYSRIPHHMNGKHHSEETKQKMSEAHKGEKCYWWKDYPRIIKNGFSREGKQKYAIKYNGKIVKESIFLDKLEKELDLLINEVN